MESGSQDSLRIRAVEGTSHFSLTGKSTHAGSQWSSEFTATYICGYQCENAMPMELYEGRRGCSLKGKSSQASGHMSRASSQVMGVQPAQPTLMRGLKPGRFVGDITLSISWPFCLIAQANCFWTCRERIFAMCLLLRHRLCNLDYERPVVTFRFCHQ